MVAVASAVVAVVYEVVAVASDVVAVASGGVAVVSAVVMLGQDMQSSWAGCIWSAFMLCG